MTGRNVASAAEVNYRWARMPSLHEKIDANAAARLPLPPNRVPAQELERYRKFLKVENHRLMLLHRSGTPGREICKARSSVLDVLLRYVLEAVELNLPKASQDTRPQFTLVAIGGYGRAELNPFSDIDIMFLHGAQMVSRGKVHPNLAAITDGLLYTLWDLGLKVGHSVRSIEECIKVANSDMQSKTSLIEARRICGSEELFQKFKDAVVQRCVVGHEQEYIAARIADQAARRAKFGNSPLMQEPNLKNGCGGLRDYQNLVWMTFFKYRTRSLSELEDKGYVSASERKQLDAAYDFILSARNELHYQAERAVDVLTRALQPSVAWHLGYQDRSLSGRIELFMRDFYMHSRNIDLITRIVEQRLALLPKAGLISSMRRMFKDRKQQKQVIDGFLFVDDQIMAAATNIFEEDPARLMRVFLYMQQRGLKLHPDLAQLIRSQLSKVDKGFIKDAHVRETFLEMLDQRGNVAGVLRQMHEVGLLGKFMPEFGRLTCLVQHEFYHQYTADEHTLNCLEKLDTVWGSSTPPYDKYAELFHSIERPYILYLALLLHDTGKAMRSGKHEQIGGQLITKVAKRLGLDETIGETLKFIVENHLLMAQISQRRDLEDPHVIKSFADKVGTVEHLQMLTLHTFADSMGTSDQLWNGFKDTLLWTLYSSALEYLTRGTEFLKEEARHREELAQEVREILPPDIEDEEVQAHFSSLPHRYFELNTAKEIASDLQLVHQFLERQVSDEEDALAPIISWHDEPDRGYSAVYICTWDREGLFSKIAGCLTASGLNILSAEILTRDDGIILDTFFVADAKTGLGVKAKEKQRFESLITKMLTGGAVNLEALIAPLKKQGPVYPVVERLLTDVSVDNEASNHFTIVDVVTEDRVGLLYEISTAIKELDLNIHLAKIITEKGAAIDSFYVTELDDTKISDGRRLEQIKRRLFEAAEPQ